MRVNPILSNDFEAATHAETNKVFLHEFLNSSKKNTNEYNSINFFNCMHLAFDWFLLGDCIICSYPPD